MDTIKYKSLIQQNRNTIELLDAQSYPYLATLLCRRGGGMQKRLLFLLDMILLTDNQQNRKKDKHGQWAFLPLSVICKKGSEYGKDKKIWSRTIILFCCVGLLERYMPTSESAETPYERQMVAYAAQSGYRNTTAFYRVPRYSERQLTYIERKAQRWIEQKGNFEEFSKSTIVDIFGSAIADRVYQNERRKPARVLERERRLYDVLVYLLDTQGYTGRTELITTAAADEPEAYKVYEKTWSRCGRRLLTEADAVYRRPREAEREQLGLIGYGWIIKYKEPP